MNLVEAYAWQRWAAGEFCRYCPHTLEDHAVRLEPSDYVVRYIRRGEPRYLPQRIADADISTVHCRRCGGELGASTATTCYVRNFNLGEIVRVPA